MHPQVHVIVAELLKRKKFVVLCTNAVLLPRHIGKFKPDKNFAWMVHLDGIGARDTTKPSPRKVSSSRPYTAIKLAKQKGFQVYTNTTVFNTETPQDLIATLDYINDELGVDRLEIAPGYAYGKAPDQDRFLGVTQTRELFSRAFADGRRKKWRFNHSQLYLDFLEGHATSSARRGASRCTASRAGRSPATCLMTATRRRGRNSWRRRTGTPSAAARTRAATTAWPTAATSRRGPGHDELPRGKPPRPRRLRSARTYRHLSAGARPERSQACTRSR